jgi:hypothetical protein
MLHIAMDGWPCSVCANTRLGSAVLIRDATCRRDAAPLSLCDTDEEVGGGDNRAMAAAAEVPEQRVTVLSVVNTTSESASPTTGRRLLDVTTGQLVRNSA